MNNRAQKFIGHEVAKTADMLQSIVADETLIGEIEHVAQICVAAIKRGNKILFAGNGGSAADAQHLAAELVGKLAYDRPGLPSMSLTTDTSILTAIGNDYGYDAVFQRQIDALGVAGDVLIGISTSGRSKNLV